jgi:hypothetical protein
VLDFLVALAQFACFIGLLYGAFLCLAHHDCVDDLRAHYDPVTGHDWLRPTPDEHDSSMTAVPTPPPAPAAPDRKLAA